MSTLLNLKAEAHKLQHAADLLSKQQRGTVLAIEPKTEPIQIHIQHIPQHQAISQKKSSFFMEAMRFLTLTVAIFTLFFVSANASSFFALAKESLFSEAQQQVQSEMQTSAGQNREEKLSLPQKKESLPQLLMSISPTDSRIIIPKIGKNVPIVEVQGKIEGTNWKEFEEQIQDALREGIVHYPGTANPGEIGNAFLTGHSSYYPWDSGRYKDVFATLGNLEIGDEYIVYSHEKRFIYRVIDKKEVKPKDTSVLSQPNDKKLSTLMTCWPLGTTLRRMIIVGEQITSD